MESRLLYSPTMKQTNLRAGCKSALQPGTIKGGRSERFEGLWYLFSSEDKYKGFSVYQREDGLIDWNQLQLCQFSMDPCLSLLPVVWSQKSMNFFKIQVVRDKSKQMCVAMIWLRVEVNRTRLCTAAAHFARNEIKYQQSRESGLFQ